MAAGNPWRERRVLNWAHQGGAWEGPSSTLHALRQAVERGAHAIELDVHCTADRKLVVCHDATVDRTTGASGAIAAMDFEQLRDLDNAYWWVGGSDVDHDAPEEAYVHRGKAPGDRSFAIASLDEVLEAVPDVFLNFDIKQTAPVVEPYEALLAETLRAHGRTDDVIVASFHDGATDAFRVHAPEFCTSMGTQATYDFYQAVQAGSTPPDTPHIALQVPYRYEHITLVTERFVSAAHEHGLAVHVWTINDEADMADLVALGVDGIISDRPSAVSSVLAAAGAAYSG